MTATLADDSRTVLLPAGFLALGTFAIGTEGFMIAPLLPVMAKDFALPVPTIALLVIVFTLVLALSSPVTTVVTGRMARKQVLLIAMALFAIGNVVAALSSSFTVLIAARVLMAIAAGLYVPAANGLAGVHRPTHDAWACACHCQRGADIGHRTGPAAWRTDRPRLRLAGNLSAGRRDEPGGHCRHFHWHRP